jgi:hypothetical protein
VYRHIRDNIYTNINDFFSFFLFLSLLSLPLINGYFEATYKSMLFPGPNQQPPKDLQSQVDKQVQWTVTIMLKGGRFSQYFDQGKQKNPHSSI